MPNTKNAVLAQTYYLIRSRDVELAEDFLHRAPRDIRTVREMNAFLHQLIAQYPADTFKLRVSLIDTNDFPTWGEAFVNDVLPYLILNRLPQNTCLRASSYLTDLTSLASRSHGAAVLAH